MLSRVQPGDIRDALPASSAGARRDRSTQIFADFERVMLPGITHWNHPGFFAYFAISGSAPGVLAEFLSAALNVQAMLWRTSPAATELEEVSLAWLRQLIGLPDAFEGVIYDTASISTLHALAAARELAVADVRDARPRGPRRSPAAPRLLLRARPLVGRQGGRSCSASGTIRCAASRPTRSSACVRTRSPPQSTTTRARGFQPIAVVATVGTTSTTSVDPVGAIAAICAREKLWLHVDAAYAGVAAMVPEYQLDPRGRGSAPTRSSSIRTSGCSRRSI